MIAERHRVRTAGCNIKTFAQKVLQYFFFLFLHVFTQRHSALRWVRMQPGNFLGWRRSDLWKVQQSCVSSSGFLLYRWDFIWDFASERQAAALGRGGRQRRGCWRKSSGARAHRQKNHLLEKINEQKSQRCPCNVSFPGAGCGGCFRERRGAAGAAGTGREQLPFPRMKLRGDAETQHKFPGWSLARTPGLALLPPAASATRLLTTGGDRIWVLHHTYL